MPKGVVIHRANDAGDRPGIKKLGYNWKDEGVGKIARIVLKLFATESEWEEYWRKRMDLNQSLMLNFKVLEVQ